MSGAIAGNLSKHVWYLLHDVLGFSTWEICLGSLVFMFMVIVVGAAIGEKR